MNDAIAKLASYLKRPTLVAVIHDLYDSDSGGEFTNDAAEVMVNALFATVGEDEAARMLDE